MMTEVRRNDDDLDHIVDADLHADYRMPSESNEAWPWMIMIMILVAYDDLGGTLYLIIALDLTLKVEKKI